MEETEESGEGGKEKNTQLLLNVVFFDVGPVLKSEMNECVRSEFPYKILRI